MGLEGYMYSFLVNGKESIIVNDEIQALQQA